MDESYSFTIIDFLYSPILIILIFMIGYIVQHRKKEENPVYKYYLPGLVVKVFASVIFLLIYTQYYGYGDTVDYIKGSYSMSGLFLKDFNHYFLAMTGQAKWGDVYFYFDNNTTFPPYFMLKDENTRAVIYITSLVNLVGLRAAMPTTILLAAFSYFGVWKLFLFFTDYYPHLQKRLTIAVLFLPSLVFWGSGVMKDTYTFAASAWFIYTIYQIFVKRRKLLLNIFLALINALIIIKIKPYIFVALFPGTIIWLLFNPLARIKNRLLAFTIMPFIFLSSFLLIMVVFTSLKGQLGDYNDMDKAIGKAKVIQEDLSRSEQYGTNSYNIGKIDGTLVGLIKVAPTAIIAGMFRPFLWESKNPVMLISGLENFFILIISLYLLIRLKFFRFFQFVFSDPILIFSFLYVILFMFAVGLASANFGALVRYKIPALPFLVASIFIMLDKYKKYKSKADIPAEESEDQKNLINE